jgi:hypothetical protein
MGKCLPAITISGLLYSTSTYMLSDRPNGHP